MSTRVVKNDRGLLRLLVDNRASEFDGITRTTGAVREVSQTWWPAGIRGRDISLFSVLREIAAIPAHCEMVIFCEGVVVLADGLGPVLLRHGCFAHQLQGITTFEDIYRLCVPLQAILLACAERGFPLVRMVVNPFGVCGDECQKLEGERAAEIALDALARASGPKDAIVICGYGPYHIGNSARFASAIMNGLLNRLDQTTETLTTIINELLAPDGLACMTTRGRTGKETMLSVRLEA